MHAFVLAYCCFIYCVDCIYSFASYKPLGAIKIMSETEDVAAADADFTPNDDLGLRGTRNNSTLTPIWRTRSSQLVMLSVSENSTLSKVISRS